MEKHLNFLSAFMFFVILGLSNLQAQEVVSTTGGNASGSGGSASYSIGQIVYTTETGTNGNSIAQGVQQPYEISIVTELPEAKDISLEISAYPNPTRDYLIVKIDASNSLAIKSLTYQIFDIGGKLLQSVQATNLETKIELSNLLPATYFVKVIEIQKEIKVFKIIKK